MIMTMVVDACVQVSGWSALHIAAWNGLADLTRLLLQSRCCDVNLPGPGCVTPVLLAAQQRHSRVIGLLVAAGCDVTGRATLRMRRGGVAGDVTALHVAAQAGHAGVVRVLMDAGAVTDATMTDGRLAGVTPLHLAVEAGHSDVIQLLVDAGSNVNARTICLTPSPQSATAVSVIHSNCSSFSTNV